MSRARRRSAAAVIAAPVGLAGVVAWLVAVPPAALAAPSGAASLAGRCTTMVGAGRAQCRAPAPAAPPPDAGRRGGPARDASERLGFADFAAGYSIYRLVSATEDQRRCRLQPTCSLFAARATRRFGLLRGLLMGCARAQMEHADQGGFLPRAVASDGKFIFFDPVERWIHGEL